MSSGGIYEAQAGRSVLSKGSAVGGFEKLAKQWTGCAWKSRQRTKTFKALLFLMLCEPALGFTTHQSARTRRNLPWIVDVHVEGCND